MNPTLAERIVMRIDEECPIAVRYNNADEHLLSPMRAYGELDIKAALKIAEEELRNADNRTIRYQVPVVRINEDGTPYKWHDTPGTDIIAGIVIASVLAAILWACIMVPLFKWKG